jgi:hypothetical protein
MLNILKSVYTGISNSYNTFWDEYDPEMYQTLLQHSQYTII